MALALPAAVGGAILFEDLLLAALGVTTAGVGAWILSNAPDLSWSGPIAMTQTAATAAAASAEVEATLAQRGLALPESCRWALSPDIALNELENVLMGELQKKGLDTVAGPSIRKAFEAAALSSSGRAFLTKEVVALLGENSAHFAALFVHELFARLGAVIMQLGPNELNLVAYLQDAMSILVDRLQACLQKIQKSWPRLLWAKFKSFFPFLRSMIARIVPRLGKGATIAMIAGWVGAVVDDMEEQGQDGYEQVTSLDWWMDLLAQRAQEAAAAKHLVYGFALSPGSISDVELFNELTPTLPVSPGQSLPGGAYRVRVDGEELPGLLVLPAVAVWDPDRVVQLHATSTTNGPQVMAWLHTEKEEPFHLVRSARGLPALVPPSEAPDEPPGALTRSGGRSMAPAASAPAASPTAPRSRSPLSAWEPEETGVPTIEGPGPAGVASWSSLATDVVAVLISTSTGQEYPPGTVPAGSYDLWAAPTSMSRMRINQAPLQLEPGRAYTFLCDGTRCRWQ